MKIHFHFRDLIETFTHVEVCKVTCNPDGTFEVPSEKDGRIAQISPKTRKALGAFLREFADRLECPDLKHVQK